MIQSLLRAMDILEIMKENSHRYTIAEISSATALPPSTVHRILQSFCERKYVIHDESSHTYVLGPALISLGRVASQNIRIQDSAFPIMKNLSYVTREDTYLNIQIGDKGLVLMKVDGPNHLKVIEEFGDEMDLHCGAIRKVLLAYQSDAYIKYYLENIITKDEAFPQISSTGLRQELMEIRKEGIAVSSGEYVHDAAGIGAPVFGADGNVIASLGIIAPFSRIPNDEQLNRLKDQVKHSAAELSYYMGHTFVRQ